MLDYAIRDIVVEDGLGGPPIEADIGVEGNVIAAIGRVGCARREIVAPGCVVAPGFIDAHTHDDMTLHTSPDNAAKLRQGVTTVITGCCGFSAFPHEPGTVSRDLLHVAGSWGSFSDYLEALVNHGIGTNMAAFVGHNTVQRHLFGDSQQPLGKRQLGAVCDEVRQSLEMGALGISTGLIYEPGKHATTEQLVSIVESVADLGGLHSTHLRDEGSGLLDSIEEALAVAQHTMTGLQISHLKAIGPRNWGSVGEALGRITAASRAGIDVAFDVYPYMAGSGPISAYFEPDAVDAERANLVQIVSCRDFPHYNGRKLSEIAGAEGLGIAELTRRIITAVHAEDTLCVIFEIDERDMLEVLCHPLSMVGSDGIPHSGGGTPHPRLYGSFPRVLGHYSRDKGVLTRSEAIRKMTSVPAVRYGLDGRGEVTVGAAADLVVFEPDKIGDRGSYSERAYPDGITHVLVNGQLSLSPEGLTGQRGGKILSRAPSAHNSSGGTA